LHELVSYRLLAIKNIIAGPFCWRERGNRVTSTQENREKNYRIDIGAYGAISVEAPSKEECLELFKEVTSIKRESKIDQAIR
jgi:hypothetical protein